MRSARYPVRGRTVASRVIGAEAVLVVPARGEAHVLNESAAAAWSMMDGSRSDLDIARDLASRYGLAGERAAGDLGGLIDGLADLGALDVKASPGEAKSSSSEPPEPTAYEPPAVAETHPMEVLAAVCASGFFGGGGGGPPNPPPGAKCRVDASLCKKLFE